MAILPTPYTIKGLELKNRIVMAPMCQYSVQPKMGCQMTGIMCIMFQELLAEQDSFLWK